MIVLFRRIHFGAFLQLSHFESRLLLLGVRHLHNTRARFQNQNQKKILLAMMAKLVLFYSSYDYCLDVLFLLIKIKSL